VGPLLPDSGVVPTNVQPRVAGLPEPDWARLVDEAGNEVPVERVPEPCLSPYGTYEWNDSCQSWLVLIPRTTLAPRSTYRLEVVVPQDAERPIRPEEAPWGLETSFATGDGPEPAEIRRPEIRSISAIERMGQGSDCESDLYAPLTLRLENPAGDAPALLQVFYGAPGSLALRGVELLKGRTEFHFSVPVRAGERSCLALSYGDLAGSVGPASKAWCLTGADPPIEPSGEVVLTIAPEDNLEPANDQRKDEAGCNLAGPSATRPIQRYLNGWLRVLFRIGADPQ